MNCSNERVLDYCAGRLEPAARSEFEQHIAGCDSCRDAIVEQGAVWSALDAWTPVEASADFDQKLYARIAAEKDRRGWLMRQFDRFGWKPALPLAAAGAALGIALMVQPPSPPPTAPDRIDVEQVEHALDDLDMLQSLNRGE